MGITGDALHLPLSVRFHFSPVYFGFILYFFSFPSSPKLPNSLSRSFSVPRPLLPSSLLFFHWRLGPVLFLFLFSISFSPGCWIRTRTCLATGRRASNYATPPSNNPFLSSLLSSPASHFSKFVKQIRMLGQVRQPLPPSPSPPPPHPPPPSLPPRHECLAANYSASLA